MTDPASATVLVADNDPGVNGLLREVLGRSGLHTAAVEDGAAALAFIEGHRVSLLVCDLDMPKMGGEEVLEKLADRADSPPIDGAIRRKCDGLGSLLTGFLGRIELQIGCVVDKDFPVET